MHIRTMRFVDRWVGVPLCALMTIARRVTGGMRPRTTEIKRLLFIKLAEQGSTVIAVPAIRRAVELVGRDNVYFLAFEENRFILDEMDLVPEANVVTIRAEGIVATLWRTLMAVIKLRGLKIDATVDLEFFARSSAALAFASGAKARSGFHAVGGEGPYRGDLLTHRLRFTPHMHTSPLYRLLVDALWEDPAKLPTTAMKPAETEDEPPQRRLGEAEEGRLRHLVVTAADHESPWPLVLLNPNCSDIMPLRAWPKERYVDLARRLLAEYPSLWVGMTGAPAEAEDVATLAMQVESERCFSLAGKTSLSELLGIYCLADLLITNDSGPAHFATLTPIHIITLFGPEHPGLFAARSPRNHVLWSGVACSPCITALNNRESPCRDNVCMKSIGVESVFNTAREVLEARTFGDGMPEVKVRKTGIGLPMYEDVRAR